MLLTHILIFVLVLNRTISIVYHHIISRQRKLLRTWLPRILLLFTDPHQSLKSFQLTCLCYICLPINKCTTEFRRFAGCSTRQKASGKKLVGKDFFAGCFLSDTQQRLCRVQTRHPAKKSGRYGAGSVIPCFVGCHVRGTRQRFF